MFFPILVTVVIFSFSQHNALIIDCSGDTCIDTTQTCPADVPCLVNCIGSSACKNAQIDGSLATDVAVVCEGRDSCIDCPITCGSGNCNIKCEGATACKIDDGNMNIDGSTANDVTVLCEGRDACQERVILCGNGNCEVTCDGEDACKTATGLGVINGTSSVDVTVACTGRDVCQNVDITCGNGQCDVSCDGQNACKGNIATIIDGTQASSFDICCDGTDACGYLTEIQPADTEVEESCETTSTTSPPPPLATTSPPPPPPAHQYVADYDMYTNNNLNDYALNDSQFLLINVLTSVVTSLCIIAVCLTCYYMIIKKNTKKYDFVTQNDTQNEL